MEKSHEIHLFDERIKGLKELKFLLWDIFWDELMDQIDSILRTPEQLSNLTEELMNKSIHYLITWNNEEINARLHFLTLERKIEQSLELVWRIDIQTGRKTIAYKNSNISYITLLTAFLIGIRDWLRKYRNEWSPEDMTLIFNT
jgi:hypothetical protein